MAILLQVQPRQVELVVGLRVLWRQRSLGSVGNGTYIVRLGLPKQPPHLQLQFIQLSPLHVNRLFQDLLRRQRRQLIIILLPLLVAQHYPHLLLTGSQHLKCHQTPLSGRRGAGGEVYNVVLRRLLHHPNLPIRHEVLHKLLLLVGHQPREVRLVLRIDSRHQLDVGAEKPPPNLPRLGEEFQGAASLPQSGEVGGGFVRQGPVPRPSKVTVAPRPLLLAGREVVAGHVEHTAVAVVLVAALEVVLRVDGHVARGHLDVLVVRYVNACRVVHLIIGTRGDGEAGDSALAVVEDGIHVGREDALVLVVHLNGWVCPPEEGLRQRRAVADAPLNLQVGAARTQRKAGHALLVEHALHLVHPHRHRPVRVLHNIAVHGQIGRWTMVLRPVELYAAADPRPCQSYEGRLDDVVVVHEVALLDFVVGHLYAPAQLGHHHHLQVFVLQEHHLPLMGCRLIGYRLDDGVRVHHPTRPLIHTLLQEDGVLLCLPNLVGRDGHYFSPSFNHNSRY